MNRKLLQVAVGCGVVVLWAAVHASAQSTDTGTSGLDPSVTTPATTTDTSTPGTTTTGSSGTTLTPFNSAQNLTSYNNMKSQTKNFQSSTGANASAFTTTATDDFTSVFLVPFLESVFEQLNALIVKIAANSIAGNALPTTSSPA